MGNHNALLLDFTRCEGCEACVYACKEENGLPDNEEKDLSCTTYTAVLEKDDLYYRRMCMHCEDPTCASVCPVSAFEKTETGAVIHLIDNCIGCRYCMQACPFNVPTYEWEKTAPKIQKCNMCYERQKRGEIPACAEACPADAVMFGSRDDMLKEAHRRIDANPTTYVNHVLGENEVGGTSVLMLSSVPFAELGFSSRLPNDALPQRTWDILSKIPSFSICTGTCLYGIWWIIDRRMEFANNEHNNHESLPDHSGSISDR